MTEWGKTNACGGDAKARTFEMFTKPLRTLPLFYHLTSTSEGACAGIELPKLSFAL